MPSPPTRHAPARVIILDDASRSLAVVAYSADGRAIEVAITPDRALRVAGELIAAATRRLS